MNRWAILSRPYRDWNDMMKADSSTNIPDPAVLDRVRANTGESLAELSRRTPVLVVFLRHAGCPFCREALADLQEKRSIIEASGTKIVLVHMQPDADAAALFAKYRLDDVPRISDPERLLYRTFDLARGSLWQVSGPAVWWRGFEAAVLKRQGFGTPTGDVFQMPGAFLLHHGHILRAFRPANSAKRPDYEALAACELPSGAAR
jgi:peroxiredoxin